ncbi:hypothetical protein GQ53DRAFT_820153 [Thozetella sp. PMI_491]|nr:hypothetical protein GQ53DRAFT_820153 [Thozetella sp. PMI_491]
MSSAGNIFNRLTVGEVAGVISGAMALISFTIQLLVALIVVWLISNDKINAATGSVSARILQGSSWPALLGTDSAHGRSPVKKRVVLASYVLTASTIILLIAHALTPLPLDSQVTVVDSLSPVNFVYAPDATFFGNGTQVLESPSNGTFSRICGFTDLFDCSPSPGLLDLLSSGSQGTTLVGPRDIKYRFSDTYQVADDKSPISKGQFRAISTLLLDSSYVLVEGLIVDTVGGGVGFRNHTVPSGLRLGATWKENILWVVPETVCANNNFTLHTLVNGYLGSRQIITGPSNNTFLQDNGAFASRNWTVPEPRWDDVVAQIYKNSPPLPDLRQRAYLAAWWNNYLTAAALNLSREDGLSIGDNYTQNFTFFPQFEDPYSITITEMDGTFFDTVKPYNEWKFLNRFIDGIVDLSDFVPGVNESLNFSNKFRQYGRRCAGFDESDPLNTTKPYIRCGNLYGVFVPSDDPLDMGAQVRSGQEIQQPAYTCASASKAVIKTVEFTLNNTESLHNLAITSVVDKNYSTPADYPYWAIEASDPLPNMNVSEIDLLWGLVSPARINDSRIVVRQGKALYLPILSFERSLASIRDTAAAATAFSAAWNTVFDFSAYIAGISAGQVPSYSGEGSYALTTKWRELSATEEGSAKIFNLIWTDLVASAIVGTKQALKSRIHPAQSLNLKVRLVRVPYTNMSP